MKPCQRTRRNIFEDGKGFCRHAAPKESGARCKHSPGDRRPARHNPCCKWQLFSGTLSCASSLRDVPPLPSLSTRRIVLHSGRRSMHFCVQSLDVEAWVGIVFCSLGVWNISGNLRINSVRLCMHVLGMSVSDLSLCRGAENRHFTLLTFTLLTRLSVHNFDSRV